MSPMTSEQSSITPVRIPRPETYNYEHFRAKHILEEVQRLVARAGVAPGAPAPDFELSRVGGGSLRLSGLRGTPVLLHFGSFT
jgi:hypothetical protein